MRVRRRRVGSRRRPVAPDAGPRVRVGRSRGCGSR
jgi:hypothetical protein